MRVIFLVFGAFLFFGSVMTPSVARALPDGFEMKTVAGGLNLPTSIAFALDGRIFVAEKSGAVRIIENEVLLVAPFLQLGDINDYGDHGLIGIALDPNFAANGWVYLSYTYENSPLNYEGPKTGRIVRIQANGNTADMSTMEIIVGTIGGTPQAPSCQDYPAGADCIPSDESSHSLGGLRFGSDGKLYATLGDGSSFEFVDVMAERAQDIDSLAGKMLRINTNGTGMAGNPFFTGDPTENRSKVWNYGLRNAFRFNFHPDTGIPYLGDVGWFTTEEVNKGVAGANFGWPCREGTIKTPGYDCEAAGFVDPWYAYPHDPNTGAGSITAGVFYEGSTYPQEYVGDYIFGDFAINFLKIIHVNEDGTPGAVEDFMENPGGPVEIVLGPDENIYYLSIYTGELRRITYTQANRDPIAVANAVPTSGLTPLLVNFSSEGSLDPDGDTLLYAWDFGDGATSSQAHPSHTYTQDGNYTATLVVSDGLGGEDSKTIFIVAGNEAPSATITSPANDSTYAVGQQVPLSGTGIDPEDGALPDENFEWTIILHHNVHIHIIQQFIGSEVSFLGADHGDSDVYIEAQLTVTDSVGLTDTTSIDLHLEPTIPTDAFRSEFYNTMDLSGLEELVRTDSDVHFNWGLSAPDPAVQADQFSARFTGDFSFPAGEYTFTVSGDDGVRLFVDGVLIIDQWIDQAATQYTGIANLLDGVHRVKLEYYDNFYNAVAELDWTKTGEIEGGTIPNPAHVITTVTPQNPVLGEEVTITTTITNTGSADPILVDIEVYESAVQVAQEFYDNEVIATNASRDFILQWTPPGIGEYGVAVGLLEVGWAGLYEWTGEAVLFTVIEESPPGASSVVIYDDSLQPGWASWSWDTNVTFGAVLEIEFTQEWGGLYLHHDALDTSGMVNLEFDIHGGETGGQELQVLAFDEQTEIFSPKRLSEYIESVPANTTVSVVIPLGDLGVSLDAIVTGFGLQSVSGNVEPVFSIDNIRLSS